VEITFNVNISKGISGDTEIFSCAIDPKDTKIALGCGDGTVRLYDLIAKDGQHPVKVKMHSFGEGLHASSVDPPITCVRWSKINHSESDAVEDYAIGAGQTKAVIEAGTSHAKHNLTNILAVSSDGSLKEVSTLYNKQTFTRVDEPGNQLFALDFDMKGYHFATAGKDCKVRYYDEEA